ncbi:hypothetical protein [Pontibacter pamirensis]|uniref:hypothetical protein n=1 Tax=Pontibacter pamirensis TaxID=2562824 RepID=UPI001389D292|nr:hypothetical protein [Pontibacter pamirensis]
MNTSNKLLMGLLLTVLLFITVTVVTARMYAEKREPGQELVAPPDTPAVPETPAPPAAE